MTGPGHRRHPIQVLTCGVALGAAVVSLHIRHDRLRTEIRTVTVAVAAPATGPAADGCPAQVLCTDGSVRPQVGRAVARAFPGSRLVDEFAVIDGTSRRPYRETVLRRTGTGVAIDATTVCGTGHVDRRSPTSGPDIGPATVTIVVPGSGGCSVAVALTVPAGVDVDRRAARRLAEDPSLQIHP